VALDPARSGHRYPTYRYEISREKVREYAAAVGFDEPQYAAEEGDVVAPATFAACFTLRLESGPFADPDLGAHPRLVHGSQEFTVHRPMHVGDVLRCTPWLAEIRSLGRNELLTLQVDCVDAAGGEPVVTARATIVFLPPAQEAV
jgi:acyl dehydratase